MALLTAVLAWVPSLSAQDASTHEAELLRLHETLLRVHRERDVSAWMAMEADSLLSANRGELTYVPRDERLQGRTLYLESTEFTAYRDLTPPVVRVSGDGTLGWVVAQVQVTGSRTLDDGSTLEIDDVWAWAELYVRGPDGWRLVGNVSNRRPTGPGDRP